MQAHGADDEVDNGQLNCLADFGWQHQGHVSGYCDLQDIDTLVLYYLHFQSDRNSPGGYSLHCHNCVMEAMPAGNCTRLNLAFDPGG